MTRRPFLIRFWRSFRAWRDVGLGFFAALDAAWFVSK
jgi:hypothetical protein